MPEHTMGARVGIAAVERDTGLGKDTLRVWERRYGFPTPLRDDRGERVYSTSQVERLRMVKRLMDAGYRPGAVVPLSTDALNALPPAPARQKTGTATERAEPATELPDAMAPWLALIRQHQAGLLRDALTDAVTRLGLADFVTQLVAPLNVAVGASWAGGELAIFEEHLYTEAMQTVLRQAIAQRQHAAWAHPPKVLLTTPPGESHGLGLLMAEAFFTLEGCQCVPLGHQTPLPDVVQAAQRVGADIVALGFSQAQNPHQVRASLSELRRSLPTTTELWAGGLSPVLQRHPVRGQARHHWPVVRVQDIGTGVARWRASAFMGDREISN